MSDKLDREWFDHDISVKQFCGLVDEFIKCIRNPDVYPTIGTGYRYLLVEFLKGNRYVRGKLGNTPSHMLKYCFGDYQTIKHNDFPQAVPKIKDLWIKDSTSDSISALVGGTAGPNSNVRSFSTCRISSSDSS